MNHVHKPAKLIKKNKLPKQWKHWCQQEHMKPLANSSYHRKSYTWQTMLKGKGRLWRVNDQDYWQVSVFYDDFDRWANSVDLSFAIPKTYAEFSRIIRSIGN